MDKQKERTEKIDGEQVQELLHPPALYVNKIYLTLLKTGMRLTFSEEMDGVEMPAARTAVYLSLEDAVSLHELMSIHIKNIKIVEAPKAEK